MKVYRAFLFLPPLLLFPFLHACLQQILFFFIYLAVRDLSFGMWDLVP